MKRSDISDLQVLQAYVKADANCTEALANGQKLIRGEGLWCAYQVLADELGAPDKVAWRACERAFDRGLLDYGTSLRFAWLTDKGKALLNEAKPSPELTSLPGKSPDSHPAPRSEP